MINDTAYLFNINGEKLFNMERAYKSICRDKIEDVVSSGIVQDESTFRQYVASGHNPRLIRRKQLNVNDEVVIRKLNDELYIGEYKVSEEQP